MKTTYSMGFHIERPTEVKKVLKLTNSDLEYKPGLELDVLFSKGFGKAYTPQRIHNWFCESRWFELCRQCDLTIEEYSYS